MSCASLAGVSKQCGPNPGGVKTTIYLARVEDIASIPTAVAGVISGDIVMKATKAMVPWAIELDSGNVSIETEGSVSSPSLKASAVFKIARNNAVNDTTIAGSLGQDLVVLIPKNSGKMQVIGSLDKGCWLGMKQGDGLKSADFAGKDITLTWEGLAEMPFYYEGDVPLTVAP
jgi:hypothetical protein